MNNNIYLSFFNVKPLRGMIPKKVLTFTILHALRAKGKQYKSYTCKQKHTP